MNTIVEKRTRPLISTSRFNQYSLVMLLVILLVVMAVWNPRFFNVRNLGSILRLSAVVGIATLGESLVLLIKGVDISVGAVMGLVSVLTAVLLPIVGIFGTVTLTVTVCALIGLVTGLLIVKGKIPPIVTTLGMMWLLRGISGSITGGRIVRITNESFVALANSSFLGSVPYFFIGFIVVGLVASYILDKVNIGKHIYAIGGSEEAAYYSGININRVKILVFMMAAITYGIGGLLLSSYLRAGMPFTAQGYEFRAITSAALGGIALSGGKGKIGNAVLGAIILTLLYSVITSFGISPYLQGMVEGIVLVVAVYLCQREK
jgi:ribose transport system permease protein